MLKKIQITIGGIHCKSCKILIESEVNALIGVKDVNVNNQTGTCSIEFDDQKISKNKIFKTIKKLNYQITETNKQKPDQNFNNLINAAILLVLFTIGYLIIKQTRALETMSKLNEGNLNYGLIFIIGLLASFHCVGMCGGLVVAYTSASKNKSSLIHWQYNLGRIISYTTIGALLGGLGSFFAINPSFNGAILILASIFMALMGLSLFTNNKYLEKIKLKTPQFIARFLYSQRHSKKPKGPFLIGLINGLMPCGPLQAMQLYALASGSLTKGALSMAFYALGTAPLLFGLGKFVSLISQEKIKQFMKFSGLVVIILGLFMFNRGLANFGYGLKALTARPPAVTQDQGENYQVVTMDVTYKGFEPNVLTVQKGVPVRWIINGKQISSCTDEIIMPDYDIDQKLTTGENIIEFTPKETGEIKFSCWMQMVWGKFIVVDSDTCDDGTSCPVPKN